jgi:hypothetical protein
MKEGAFDIQGRGYAHRFERVSERRQEIEGTVRGPAAATLCQGQRVTGPKFRNENGL